MTNARNTVPGEVMVAAQKRRSACGRPRSPSPAGVPDEEAPGAVVGGPVPRVAEARDLDARPGVRRVDEAAAADVHADVADAVEEDEVAGREAPRATRRPRSKSA